MKNVIKLVTMALLCLIIYSCQNEELTDNQSSMSEKARLWYETNHNFDMNKHTNFNGLPDWKNSFRWQDEIYFPLVKKWVANKAVTPPKTENRIYTRSFLVLKDQVGDFTETLVVFTSKDFDEITNKTELKKLPKMVYTFNKKFGINAVQYVGSSFNGANPFIVNNGDNPNENFRNTKDDCNELYAYETNCYSNGVCESHYLYTMTVCTGQGGSNSDGGTGGSGNGDTGGGSGGEDTPDPILTNDMGSVTPRTVCGSIKFTRKGNRIVAAIDKVRIHIKANGYFNPDFEMYLTFPSTVYISFPNNIPLGKAQKLTAFSIQDVSFNVSKFIEQNTTEGSFERSPLQIMKRVRRELKNNVGLFNGKAEYLSDNSSYAQTNIDHSTHETTYNPFYRNTCGN
ncbi:hypothetical protein [Aquimarina aggregata]|uniref:hypothetical protein n=1 Tax=Aquimarina aggregata TaxID=1642818 RepID=UPI0024907638|nr:hypothetical protein [Aquimarina aggregata]